MSKKIALTAAAVVGVAGPGHLLAAGHRACPADLIPNLIWDIALRNEWLR